MNGHSILLKSLLALLILSSSLVNAENTKTLFFVSGDVTTTANIALEKSTTIDNSELVNGNYYRIIQFNAIPSTSQKEALKNANITLLNYMPNNAFYAQIKKPTSFTPHLITAFSFISKVPLWSLPFIILCLTISCSPTVLLHNGFIIELTCAGLLIGHWS